MSTPAESHTPTQNEVPHPFMTDNEQHNPFLRGDENHYPAGMDRELTQFTSAWRNVIESPGKLQQWYESKNYGLGVKHLERLEKWATNLQDDKESDISDLCRNMDREGYKDDGTGESMDTEGKIRCPNPFYCLEQYTMGYPILVDTASKLHNKWKPKFEEAHTFDDLDVEITYTLKRSELLSMLKERKRLGILSHSMEDGHVSLAGTGVKTGSCDLRAITSYSADAASSLSLPLDVLKLTKLNPDSYIRG